MARWVANDYGDADVPVSWQAFSGSVRTALRDVMSNAGRVHNCSVTRYTFSGERVSLDAFNDVSHLPVDMQSYR